MSGWEWADPPQARSRGRYDALRRALRASPGRWAAVTMSTTTLQVIGRQEGPWAGFEATSRGTGNSRTTYVRYNPEEEQ